MLTKNLSLNKNKPRSTRSFTEEEDYFLLFVLFVVNFQKNQLFAYGVIKNYDIVIKIYDKLF